MDTTSLDQLMKEVEVALFSGGLSVEPSPSWIVPGEDRLSYTTLIRLVECCREHHWRSDILPFAQGAVLDSITKSLQVTFLHPILLGSVITIVYEVTGVRQKGYSLRFTVRNRHTCQTAAEVEMICVFYDALAQAVNPAPPGVYAYLLSLIGKDVPCPSELHHQDENCCVERSQPEVSIMSFGGDSDGGPCSR